MPFGRNTDQVILAVARAEPVEVCAACVSRLSGKMAVAVIISDVALP